MTKSQLLDAPWTSRILLVLLVLALLAHVARSFLSLSSEQEQYTLASQPEAGISEGTGASAAEASRPPSLFNTENLWDYLQWSPERRPGMLAMPQSPATPVDNDRPAEILEPQLLDDTAETATYLDAFPEAEYQIVGVVGVGRFHVDTRPDTVKDVLREGHPWEPHIRDLLTRLVQPGTTALDIGAHIGTHTLTMAQQAGADGRVYAFEPQRKLHRELTRNMELNGLDNVVPLRYAVGAEAAVIEMNASDGLNEGGTSVGRGGDRTELRTLDSFGFHNVSVMKIDVEGFEDPVLEGARQTIARERPVILVEILGGFDFDRAWPEERAAIGQTIRTIEDMGYLVQRVSMYDYVAFPLALPAP